MTRSITDNASGKSVRGWLKWIAKLVVSAACLYYIGQKINWAETLALLRKSNVLWIALATVFFVASKLMASVRLQVYFKNIGIHLLQDVNAKLYWLGMFYNLFLPGGIGGDAYKGILLSKRFQDVAPKKIAAAILLDRISGVAGLAILAGCFFYWVHTPKVYSAVGLAIIPPGIFLFWWMVKKWFPSFTAGFFPTLWMGMVVQALQVGCIFCIMLSLDIRHHFAVFQFLFLISSIVAIFPFTIGGLGARELVFLWGAQRYELLPNEAVYVSILFYLITVVVSFVGLIWEYNSPWKTEAAQAEGRKML
jgi:hypothetical protein